MKFLAVAISFVVSFALCPVITAVCCKYGWYDEINPRKIHKEKVPRLGGIAIFTGLLISVAYFSVVDDGNFSFVLPAFVGGILVFVMGILDDFLNLRARLKFAVQIVAAIIMSLGECYFDEIFGFKFPVPWITGRVLTVFWVIFFMNAYNLIDGIDWLCSGLSFLALGAISVIFLYKGFDVGVISLSLCAAILGFMFWNKPDAKIFLGDGGSETLGYAIAIFPMLLQGDPVFNYNKIILCALLSAIPCIDVFAAIFRRVRDKRSIFSSDRGHLHHKLLNIGFSRGSILVFLLTFQFLISCVAVMTLFITRDIGLMLIASVFSFVILFFITIHYINRAVNIKMRGHLADCPQKEH